MAAEMSTLSNSKQDRLNSILEQGILSRAEMEKINVSYGGGYDSGSDKGVFLNFMQTLEGVDRAVSHSADGIFAVGIERANDYNWILSIQDLDDIEKIFKEKFFSVEESDDMYPLLERVARNEHLKKNQKFLEEIGKRVNNLAVLVLNLSPTPTESGPKRAGYHDTVREKVKPTEISHIILSKNQKETLDISKISQPVIFADSKTREITYVYKEPSSNVSGSEKVSLKLNIEVPDFAKELAEIFKNTSCSQMQPMFIHTTRL